MVLQQLQQQHYRVTRGGGIRLSDLQATAREAWKLMHTPGSSAHTDALANGIDVAQLPKRLREMVDVRPDGAGLVTVEGVVVGFIGRVAWDVWKYVLLPQIRRKWGDDALRPLRGRAVGQKAGARAGRRKAARKKKLVGRG
jgi:hypothetical protein